MVKKSHPLKIGQKFGKLTVLNLEYIKEIQDKNGSIRKREYYKCLCECGNPTIVLKYQLTSGKTKSCGCINKEWAKTLRPIIHGKSKTRLYRIWANMHDRCMRKKCPAYKDYGGRGIAICNDWLKEFSNFYNWAMNNGYKNFLSLDRIDFNGNYEPSNCRWVNAKTQNRNSRQCVYYEYQGKKYTRGELSELSGLSYDVIRYRLNHNWDIETALTLKPHFFNRVNKN